MEELCYAVLHSNDVHLELKIAKNLLALMNHESYYNLVTMFS